MWAIAYAQRISGFSPEAATNTGKTLFAQLPYRESLRDIEVCLSAQAGKIYAQEDLGLESSNPVYALDSMTIDACVPAFR